MNRWQEALFWTLLICALVAIIIAHAVRLCSQISDIPLEGKA